MRQRIVVITESTRKIGIVSEIIGTLGIGLFYPLMAFGNDLAAYWSLLVGVAGFSALGLLINHKGLLITNSWAAAWIAKIIFF